MINVTIQPFGRQLVMMMLAAAKFNAVTQIKQQEQVKKTLDNLQLIKDDRNAWIDLSSNMTTNMLDKRFKTKTYKKSLSENDKRLKFVVDKQVMRSRTVYNAAVSNYNKNLIDKNINTSLKTIDFNKVVRRAL